MIANIVIIRGTIVLIISVVGLVYRWWNLKRLLRNRRVLVVGSGTDQFGPAYFPVNDDNEDWKIPDAAFCKKSEGGEEENKS